MANVNEETIKDLKYRGECAMCSMKNHKLPWLSDDGSFNNIINDMHNANSKDKLSEAYHGYIINAMSHGYSVDEIIGGIMQNEDQNVKFNVDIDSVIKSVLQIKSPLNISSGPAIRETKHITEPAKVKEVSTSGPMIKESRPIIGAPRTIVKASESAKSNDQTNAPAGGVKVNDKLLKKIRGKINYITGLSNKLQNNNSTNPVADIKSIITTSEEAEKMIVSIDPTSCTEAEIAELNDATNVINLMKSSMYGFMAAVDNAKQASFTQSATVQQPEAAHTEGGFNIANFIKQGQQPVKGPTITNNSKPSQQSKPTAFPHQICGLTDEQIVEEVGKHFKVLESLQAYPLYDLANNKLLARKMKELDAKQRPNNPYLTQVNINEYIDVPELLAQYSLCFTMPCNDKKQIIIVLFNPVAVPNKNGVLEYPIHIFKATKSNNTKNGGK